MMQLRLGFILIIILMMISVGRGTHAESCVTGDTLRVLPLTGVINFGGGFASLTGDEYVTIKLISNVSGVIRDIYRSEPILLNFDDGSASYDHQINVICGEDDKSESSEEILYATELSENPNEKVMISVILNKEIGVSGVSKNLKLYDTPYVIDALTAKTARSGNLSKLGRLNQDAPISNMLVAPRAGLEINGPRARVSVGSGKPQPRDDVVLDLRGSTMNASAYYMNNDEVISANSVNVSFVWQSNDLDLFYNNGRLSQSANNQVPYLVNFKTINARNFYLNGSILGVSDLWEHDDSENTLFTATIAGTGRPVGNVGINVTYPKARLDVERAIRISDAISSTAPGTILFNGQNVVGVVSQNNGLGVTRNLNVNYLPNNFDIPNDDLLYFMKKNGALIDKFEAPFFSFHDSDQLLLIEDRDGRANEVPRLNVLDANDQLAFEVGHDGRIRSSGSSQTNLPNVVANVGVLNVSRLYVNGMNQECRILGTHWYSSIAHDLGSGCLDPDYSSMMNIYFDSPLKNMGSVAISYRGTEGNYPSNAGLELAYSGDMTLPEPHHYQTGLSFSVDNSSVMTPSVSYTMGVNIQYPHKFFVVQGTDLGQSRDGVFTPLFTMTSSQMYGLRMVTPNASFHIKAVTEDIGFLMNRAAGQDEVTQPVISIENETGPQATYLIFDTGMASLRAGLVDSNQWATSNFYQKNTAAMGRNSWVNGANSTILGGENNTIRLIPQSEFSAYRMRYGLSESSSKPFAENGFSVGDGNTIYSENSIALGRGVTINYDSTFMFSAGSPQIPPFRPTQTGQFLIDANLFQIMPKSNNNQSNVLKRFFSVHPLSIDSNWIQSAFAISSANAEMVFNVLTNKGLILNNQLNVTVFDVNTIYQSKDGLKIVFDKQAIRSCVEDERNLDTCLNELINDESNVGVDNEKWLENIRPIVALHVLDHIVASEEISDPISIPEFAATVNLSGTVTPSVVVAQIVSPDAGVLSADFETRISGFKTDVKAQMIDSLIKNGILDTELEKTSELFYPFDEDDFESDPIEDLIIADMINRLKAQFEAPLVQFRGVTDDDGAAVSVFRNQLNLGGVSTHNIGLQVSNRMAVAGDFNQYRNVTSSMVALIGTPNKKLITIMNNGQFAFEICSTGELRLGAEDSSACAEVSSTMPSHNIVVSGDFVVDGELTFGDGLRFDFNSMVYFKENGSDTYYTSGNVGIGVTTPNTLLSLPFSENNQSNALSFYSDGMQMDIEARQSALGFTTDLSNLNSPPIINIQENGVGLLTHTPNSGARLHVEGNVAVTTLNFGVGIDSNSSAIFLVTTGNVSRLNINGQFVGFQTTVWTKQDQYTYISDNNVSIGKDFNTPSFVFEVSGNAKFDMLNTQSLSGSELNVQTVAFNGSDYLTTEDDNLLINGGKLLSGVYASTSGATGNSVQFLDQVQSVLSKETAIYWEDPQNTTHNYFSYQDENWIFNNQYQLNSSANLTIDGTQFLIEKDVQSINMSYSTQFLIDPNRDRSSGIEDLVASLQTDVSEFPDSFSAQRINVEITNTTREGVIDVSPNYYGLGIEMTGPTRQKTNANVTGLSIDVSEMQEFPGDVYSRGGVFSAIFKGSVGIGKVPESNFPSNYKKPIIDIAGLMKVQPFDRSNVTLNLNLFASGLSVKRSFLVNERQVVVGRAIGEDGGFNPGAQFSLAVEENMAAHNVIATGNRGITAPYIALNKENDDAFFILQNTYPVFQFNHDGIPPGNEFVGYRFPYHVQAAYHANHPDSPVKKQVKHIDIEVVTSNFDTLMVGKQVEIRLRQNDRIQGAENQPVQLSGVQLNIDDRFTVESAGKIIGVNVDVPTGDAAVFMGGAVGIGISAPTIQLDVNGFMAFRTSSNLILNNSPYPYVTMPSLETIVVNQQLDAGQLGKITQAVSRVTVNNTLIVASLNINIDMGTRLMSSQLFDFLDVYNLASNRIALQRTSVRSGVFNDGVTANVVTLNVVNNSEAGIQVILDRSQKLSVTNSLKSNQFDDLSHFVFDKPSVSRHAQPYLYVTQNAVHFYSNSASPNLMNTSIFDDLTANRLISYSQQGPQGTPLSISSDAAQPLFRYEQVNPQFILKSTIPFQSTRETTIFQDYTLYDIDIRYSNPELNPGNKTYYGALLTVTNNQATNLTVTGVSINVAAVSGTKYAALFTGGAVGIGNLPDITSQLSLKALTTNTLLNIDDKMVVKDSKVGMAKINPSYVLDINGEMKLMADNTTVMHIDNDNIQIGEESNDNARLFLSDDMNVNDAFFVNAEQGKLGIGGLPFGNNAIVVSGNARFEDFTMSELNLANNILVEGAGRVEIAINTSEQLNQNLELVSVKLNNYVDNTVEQSIYGTKIDVQVTNNMTVNGIKVDMNDLQIRPTTTGTDAHDSEKYAAAFMGEYRFNGERTPFVRVGIGTDTPSKMLDISGNQQLAITPEISTMSMLVVGQRQLDSNFGFGIALGVTQNTDFATFVVVSENQTDVTRDMSLLLVSPNKVAFGYGHDLKTVFDDVNAQFLIYGGMNILSNNSIRFNSKGSNDVVELRDQGGSAEIWLYPQSNFQIQFKNSSSQLVTPITFKSNINQVTTAGTQTVQIGDYDGNANLSVGSMQATTPTLSVFKGQKNQTVMQLHSNASPQQSIVSSFIDFKKNSERIGLIGELYDEGGIAYVSKGADYAEYLEKKEPLETFLPGDVVGVFGGKISKDITNANFAMVISEMPIVVANYPGDENQSQFELVGFLGQVKVNVEGPVLPGDFLVPSGRHDGVAIALKLDRLVANQVPLLIGRALESYSEKGVGQVKTLVGFYTQADILSLYSSYLNQRVETLGQQNTALKSEFNRYETKRRAQIQKLQKIANQQDVKS